MRTWGRVCIQVRMGYRYGRISDVPCHFLLTAGFYWSAGCILGSYCVSLGEGGFSSALSLWCVDNLSPLYGSILVILDYVAMNVIKNHMKHEQGCLIGILCPCYRDGSRTNSGQPKVYKSNDLSGCVFGGQMPYLGTILMALVKHSIFLQPCK